MGRGERARSPDARGDLGHQAGDDLLRSCSRRIARALPGAVVARMGGDEFAALVELEPGVTAEEATLSLVQQLALPTQVAGTEVVVSATVGVVAISAGSDSYELIHQADVALYRAKEAGKNCYRVFDAGISNDPTRLVIEVTETSVADDPKRMIATLHSLSDLGIRIALDDFGAGATALSNLWHFPLDIVKLDRSLVSPLVGAGDRVRSHETSVRAIIDLCHAHDLVVTAEGVEHPEQADALRTFGCDYAQGWYFGRPTASFGQAPAQFVDAAVRL